MLLGSSCAVSGTGFFFSRRILNKMGGWQYHLLTEDIQFSTHQILQGETIGFCKDAELYDEQPITFRQSWRQRLRWAKGFLQVFRRYGKGLVQGTFRKDFSCYDMGMTIMPAFVLTLSLLFAYVVAAVLALVTGHSVLPCLKYIGQAVGVLYVFLYFVGAFTTVTQRHKIHTTPAKKFLYTFTFPVFMLTYLPISLTALVTKVQWKPIEHHRADRQVLEAAVGRK
jgi:cellulose synthase/poly-beta-1,6-N-acetylglucosamine synthase-like glycosyltransferase